jgi:CxxC motif-containing protein (DUF1111 family)/mono/diheme cytochrome c family protein
MANGIGGDRRSRALIASGVGATFAALLVGACSSKSLTDSTAARAGGGATSTNSSGGALGNGGGSSAGMNGAGSASSCVPAGSTAPMLPASFFSNCSACHSAYGASANPAIPNLFMYTDSADAFAMTVRQGKNMDMPAFAASLISDADVTQIYNYFKGGVSSNAPTCMTTGDAGTEMTAVGACSGQTLSYSPLFTDSTTTLDPISKVDPTTKHIIFRGAGRVRFRHEMEDTFEIYHDHYFEGRTFGYILDDSIPAGGTTIGVTFLPSGNQYYSKQTNANAQQGGADLNIRAWKIYGGVDGNAFAMNAGGASNNVLPFGCASDPNAVGCDTKKYTFTITRNDREGRPIQMGDQLQIEFGMFLARYPNSDGMGPPVDSTHVRNITPLPNGCTTNGAPYDNNCYTQANYYSDSFRYVVGSGTLTPYNQDCTMTVPVDNEGMFPHPYDCSPTGPIAQAVKAGTLKDRTGPDEAGWSGGIATLSYLHARHDLYYSQMAPNILQENAENFGQGRRLFHTDYTTGEHIEANNGLTAAETAVHADMAGPLYNQVACEGCHSHNNRGVPPAAGMPFDSMVVRVFGSGKDANGGPLPDANYGRQLQPKALGGGTPEGTASFTYATVNGMFKDGTPYTLTKPTTTFSNMAAGNPTSFSTRMARPLIGMGLLEAIPEADILANADPTDCNQDGISGVPNLVFDPEDGKMHVGRFGWKAAKASVRQQVTEALNFDIGVTSSVYPKHDCGPMEAACLAADKPTPELADSDVNLLVTYMRDLGVPPRRDLTDPQVMQGEALFTSLGCVHCHAPNQHTGDTTPFLEMRNQVIHPYSDLLLHDMGPDLADNSGQTDFAAGPSEWRTPPLWGIGLCDEVAAGFQGDDTLNTAPNLGPCHYLHDGRASQLIEAVLWHGGEAQTVRDKVVALASADRDALVAFLKSL